MWTHIRDLHRALIRGETSVTKLCNDSFRVINETKNLNAFITTRQDEALREAQSLDHQLSGANVTNVSPLYGVPISIKDNFCTNQLLTTCGSKMLHNFIPPYDATAVAKLKQANCIITGKTNMDEFAMGSSSTTSYFKPAANYWNRHLLGGQSPSECTDPTRWFMAGGSSTGSAISVASGACFASLGTDTGGSTRQPASLTGVVGFKPTYGLISRFGLIPLAHCLDVVSLLARNVGDTSLVFEQVMGLDENDLTSVDHTRELKRTRLSNGLINQKIRVGIPEEFVAKGDLSGDVACQYEETIRRLTDAAAGGDDDSRVRFEVVKIPLANANLATECYTIISSAEIASNMSCYDGVKYGLSIPYDEQQQQRQQAQQETDDPTAAAGRLQAGELVFDRNAFFRANRDAGFGLEVKKRILLGNYFMLEGNREKYLHQALKLRRLISDDFTQAFKENHLDVILLPSTPTTTISYAAWLAKQDENKLFGEDYFLIPANLANVPSISLPSCGGGGGGGRLEAGSSVPVAARLPVGMQLIAERFHDRDLLLIAEHFEKYILGRGASGGGGGDGRGGGSAGGHGGVDA